MEHTAIKPLVIKTIEQELGVDVRSPGDLIKEDLGADSLDIASLTLALEDEFNLQIPDVDVKQLATVHDVVTYIVRRCHATT